MYQSLASEQSLHFNLTYRIGDHLYLEMDVEVKEQHQPKQERVRTRWTPALDKIFADIVVHQIEQGNRSNNVFDKKTWNHIREEFNRQTCLNFNNNQLRKHLDVLRTRYHNLQSSVNQNDMIQDPCFIGFDLWDDIEIPLKIEPAKTRDCPIYDQLSVIFADSGVEGKYAQSSHYEVLGKSTESDLLASENINPTPTTQLARGNGSSSSQNITKNTTSDKKRKLSSNVCTANAAQSDCSEELHNTMAKALWDMIHSSKIGRVSESQGNSRFTITNCIKALDEIEGIEDRLYYAALDLFENPNLREMFLSLKSNAVRLTWLRGKCEGVVCLM